MTKICYEEKRFNRSTLAVIEQADEIIAEYQAEGMDLTLRQLYYQFVSRDLLPNKQKEYKRLGRICSEARLAGLLPWDAIEDRTRELKTQGHWSSPKSILESAANGFRLDMWANQPVRPEVWIEKDALTGVISSVCENLDVPYFACKGYTSSSAAWRAAQRLLKHTQAGQRVVLLHLGDHDPSGMDMTRDIIDRLDLFGVDLRVKRIALNMDQIDYYNPPPNPVKETDSRSGGYAAKYGESSWELDALEPRVMRQLITEEVQALRDEDVWADTEVLEKQYQDDLWEMADKYQN
jgi:hypothetical protein